ncbi:MAG TPA: hypothetical protein VF682_24645 [Pseudomonas sp.]|jgi:hypothetical protein
MDLVEIFIPKTDNDGRAFPAGLFSSVRQELVDRFGGMTAFTREPVEGLWGIAEDGKRHDTLIIYEVMVQEVDRLWWEAYKLDLEKRFAQDELVIRFSTIEMI